MFIKLMIISIFCCINIACTDNSHRVEYKKQSESEKTCVKQAKQQVHNLFVEQLKDEINNYDNTNGYISELVQNRREMERACYLLAECYEANEKIKTIEFSDCLDGWEHINE